jgi:hypothetical protein
MKGQWKFVYLLLAIAFHGSRCMQAEMASAEASGAHLGILTAQKADELGGVIQFDLNLLRLSPELLENKIVMSYFIALNNCQDRGVEDQLRNELDHPKLVAYYKPKAQEILHELPRFVRTTSLVGEHLHLGEYDTARNAFPLLNPTMRGPQRPEHSLQLGGDVVFVVGDRGRDNLKTLCPVAHDMLPKHNELPREYHIFYSPIGFDELPMPEEEARAYIHSHSAVQRAATLRIDIHIQDKAPRLWATNERLNRADFSGQAARIGVVSANDQKVIGSLLDDGTIDAPPTPRRRPNRGCRQSRCRQRS